MAQQLKSSATKPDNLQLSHCRHMREGENRMDSQKLSPDLHTPVMTCSNNNN